MAPFTPEKPPPRRTASLPVQSPSGPGPQTEVLYALPSARIVQFQTTGWISRRSSSQSDSPLAGEEAGTLSWVSRFERTLAVGPFRIYRAPGSVAFLSCQNALRPILPKSQCWVVDEASSKFVLQIKRPQYWRIEIPNETPEERLKTEELKDVLEKLLLFEKTPCPFQRSFVVDLPEESQIPTKKKPWRPVERSIVESESKEINSEVARDSVKASQGRFYSPAEDLEVAEATIGIDAQDSDAFPKPMATKSDIESMKELDPEQDSWLSPLEGEETGLGGEESIGQPPRLEPSVVEEFSLSVEPSSLMEDESDATDDTNTTPKRPFQPVYQSMTFDSESRNPPPLQHCSRSVTAPPVLSLVTSPPSRHREESQLKYSDKAELESDFSSSVDSFHSLQSWHSPLAPLSPPASSPPSPVNQYPYPHNNIVLPKRPARLSRDFSELTVTPETTRIWEVNPKKGALTRSRSSSPPPKTPTLVEDPSDKSDDEQFEIVTPPPISSKIRHRATTSSNSRRRELSPLPAAINLFTPQRRRSRQLRTARHLPTAIVQKTCEILLSPPSHLLHLMISIASKIAAGEWRGVLSGHGESVHWDFEDEYASESWAEDDYGISLRNEQTKKATNMAGGSWEID